MKRTSFILICLILFCSASAFASPLRDYSPGKAAVDITLTDLKLKSTPAYWDKKFNPGFGVTAGLGNNWALQYKYHHWSASRNAGGAALSTTASVNELNLLYKLDKNFSAFIGANSIGGSLGDPIQDSLTFQFGMLGVTTLADRLTGWGLMSTGSNNFSAELGVGYALTKRWELNLYYTYKYFDGISFSNMAYPSFNARNQGLGVGVTASF